MMCGIAGIIDKKRNIVDKEQLEKMNVAMEHRGPDDGGVYVNQGVGLAHRRLSILDLSECGHQPMFSGDKRFVIVFNGEIYNYLEIKEQLKKEGITFITETDTEVILEAYRCWGKECAKKFNGMWSFVLYDMEKKLLFFSRDRFGVKPLYIYEDEDELIFASEIKCITTIRPALKEADMVQVARYLRGFQEDIDEHTFYKNIKNFPKSNNMVYHLTTGQKEYNTYWKLDVNEFKNKWSGGNPYKKFRMLLEDAIRLRLRADVPVGASLSGGIDSSVIVGVSSKKYKIKMNTFSSVYEEKECNEKEYIDCVNEEMNTIPHYIYPDKSDSIMDNLKTQIYYHDGPCQSASPYSGFCVYKGVGKTVKVLLDGQGADELFGGYLFFYTAKIKELFRKNTRSSKWQAMQTILEMKRVWPESLRNYLRYFNDETLIKMLGIEGYKEILEITSREAVRKGGNVKDILDKDIRQMNLELDFSGANEILNELDKALYMEFAYKKLPRILHDVDRNSMAHSLEVRLPFLDYRIVEFAFTLSDDYKIRKSWTKYIVRKSCRRYMPKKVYCRRNKMGFPAPFSKWIADERFKEEIKGYLDAFKLRGLVDGEVLEQHYQEQLRGIKDWSEELFRMMSLEIWLQGM